MISSLESSRKHRWSVVLAGGDGTRLQKLTHRITGDLRPKQFCTFFGGKSLLSHTRERIAPLFDEERTLFALARGHAAFYHEQLADVHDSRRVAQPMNRGTAVAMALCLQAIVHRAEDEDASVAFFPSDHHYVNSWAFRASVQCGLRMIDEYPHAILILGAEARYPEVEYGWIEPGRTLVDSRVHPLRRVSRFWEKPALEHAEELRKMGCLWNTFVTIGKAGAFLELLQTTVPHLVEALEGCLQNGRIEQFYDKIAPVDFSRSVLASEPGRLVVLKDAASGWTDLGSPRRVVELLGSELCEGKLGPLWATSDIR